MSIIPNHTNNILKINDKYNVDNNNLNFNNKEKINIILKKFNILADNYYDSFKQNLEIYNKIQFENYFKNKKNNIDDLDPNHNNYLIISKLQEEWFLRITNIKKYYHDLFLKPIENTETNTISSYIKKSIDYIFKTYDVITDNIITNNEIINFNK